MKCLLHQGWLHEPYMYEVHDTLCSHTTPSNITLTYLLEVWRQILEVGGSILSRSDKWAKCNVYPDKRNSHHRHGVQNLWFPLHIHPRDRIDISGGPVLPFWPKYRLIHPENYLFSLSQKKIWIKVSKQIFNLILKKEAVARAVYWRHYLYAKACAWDWINRMTSYAKMA